MPRSKPSRCPSRLSLRPALVPRNEMYACSPASEVHGATVTHISAYKYSKSPLPLPGAEYCIAVRRQVAGACWRCWRVPHRGASLPLDRQRGLVVRGQSSPESPVCVCVSGRARLRPETALKSDAAKRSAGTAREFRHPVFFRRLLRPAVSRPSRCRPWTRRRRTRRTQRGPGPPALPAIVFIGGPRRVFFVDAEWTADDGGLVETAALPPRTATRRNTRPSQRGCLVFQIPRQIYTITCSSKAGGEK